MTRLSIQDRIRGNARAAPIRIRRALLSVGATPKPSPIFILGHQKSGTSAVAALLGELTGSSVTIDLVNENRRPTFQQVVAGQTSFDRFIRRNRLDFSRDIVKEPNLTFLYSQLANRFPRARFVMVVRDPRANIKSILDRLGWEGDQQDISDAQLRELPPGWSPAFDPGWLHLGSGTYIETLAARWALCADVYLKRPQAFRLVRYEDFLSAKLKTLEGLAGDLDLECRNDIGARLDVPFQPPGNHRISVSQFFSLENLSLIDRICGPQMKHFGYLSPPASTDTSAIDSTVH